MLRRQFFALALATALLLSVAAWPVTAAPAPQVPESPSIVSTVIAWIYQAVGLDAPDLQVQSKSGSTSSPDLSGSSDGGDTLTTQSDDGSDDGDSELGSFLEPGG